MRFLTVTPLLAIMLYLVSPALAVGAELGQGVDYNLFWQMIAGALAIIALTAVWNRRLDKEVKVRKQAEVELTRYRDHLEELVKERSTELEQKNQELAAEIVERQRYLEALAYANECFQQALNSPQHILYRLNAKTGGYDYISHSFGKITGHPMAELAIITLDTIKQYFHPEDVDRVFGAIDEAIRTRPAPFVGLELEYRFRKADGGYCWFHDSTTACFDDQGNLKYFFGSAIDITERKQNEERLKENEVRYRQLVEQSSAWIWKTDAELRHIYSNDNVRRILGYSPEELYAQDTLNLVHPDDHETLRKTAAEALASRSGWSGLVLRWLTRDGQWRSVESSGGPLYDAEGCFIGLQGVDNDITDRLMLEQEREKGQRLESLGLLAGGIAHDFNNILTGIVGNLSLARMMIDREHRAAERLEECERAAKRASELTQQLLTFARGGEPVKKAVDVAKLVNEAVSFGLRGSSIKGIVELGDALWHIDADEGQINQALNNLLINSTQAMPDGGIVTVKAENLIKQDPSDKSDRFVRLSIRDTGPGIPPAILAKVFDPYFTTKTGGTGLGLASVYSIVTRHGGTVYVSSEPGKGTEFVICLPATGETGEALQESTATELSGTPYSGRALVMDDEQMILEVISMMLVELGFKVDTCESGVEAVAHYQAAVERGEPYTIVILDLTVPGGMGGLEAAGLIRAIDPEATLIVSSGYSHDAVLADFSRHGFSGAVSKPYTMDNLIEELNRVIERSGHSRV